MTTKSIALLSDEALLRETSRAAADERHATARLITLMMEVDRRRLYLGRGYSSMFVYSTRELQMSEHAAYSRITAARLTGRFPQILPMLSTGELTLSSVGALAAHLAEENAEALLDAARGKSTREVERLIAALYPAPDIPASIRALAASRGASSTSSGDVHQTHSTDTGPSNAESVTAPSPAPGPGTDINNINKGSTDRAAGDPVGDRSPDGPAVRPIAPRRYLLRVTISQEAVDNLERARALLRHAVPDGDPAELVERALKLLVKEAEQKRFAVNGRGRRGRPAGPMGRYISAHDRRLVWERDGGQCAFIGTAGRCQERSGLEFHHVEPHAAGGRRTADNIELRCRAHNVYEAELYFGQELMQRYSRDPAARAGIGTNLEPAGATQPPPTSPYNEPR